MSSMNDLEASTVFLFNTRPEWWKNNNHPWNQLLVKVRGDKSWRYLCSSSVFEYEHNDITIVGRLPPNVFHNTEFRPEYVLPPPCIHNAKNYRPFWINGRWVSMHRETGSLYDFAGNPVDPTYDGKEETDPVREEGMKVRIVSFIKKYW